MCCLSREVLVYVGIFVCAVIDVSSPEKWWILEPRAVTAGGTQRWASPWAGSWRECLQVDWWVSPCWGLSFPTVQWAFWPGDFLGLCQLQRHRRPHFFTYFYGLLPMFSFWFIQVSHWPFSRNLPKATLNFFFDSVLTYMACFLIKAKQFYHFDILSGKC